MPRIDEEATAAMTLLLKQSARRRELLKSSCSLIRYPCCWAAKYLHVSNLGVRTTVNPLDRLPDADNSA